MGKGGMLVAHQSLSVPLSPVAVLPFFVRIGSLCAEGGGVTLIPFGTKGSTTLKGSLGSSVDMPSTPTRPRKGSGRTVNRVGA